MPSMKLIGDLIWIIFLQIKFELDIKMILLLICFNSMNPTNFSYLKSTIETLEKGVKHVQNY